MIRPLARLAPAALLAVLAASAPPPLGAQQQDEPGAPERPDSLATRGLPLEPTRTLRYTVREGSWMSVDVSPDGSTLVFDLLGDLYTLPVGGGRATPLLTGPAFEAQPRFSPDGSEIVFVSDRSGGQNLWILAADGSDTTRVTEGNGNLWTSPEWTPDGRYLIASKTFSPLGGAAKPWLVHRDGGAGVALVDEPANLKLLGAAFGPDERWLYLAEGTGDWTYDAPLPEYQLTVYDRDTGERQTITSRYGSAFRPAISPDGRTLVYGTRHEDATGLRARDLESGAERWLVHPVQRDDQESRATLDILPGYAFLPDGSAVVASWGGKLWRQPLDGSAAAEIPFEVDVELHIGPRLDFDYAVGDEPTFLARQVRDAVPSPDGTRLAFTALDRLWVVGIPGAGEPTRLAEGVEGVLHGPAWSPDGRTIAFASWDDEGGGHLWTVPAGGGDPRQVSRTAAFVRNPVWSADGARIAALRSPARSRLEGDGGGPHDLVWYPAGGGEATSIAPTQGRGSPHVRPGEPNRLYLYSGQRGLVSIRWDGTDEKTHLKVTGFRRSAGGEPPPAGLVLMAPEGDRALAQIDRDLYVVTVPRIGTAPTVSVANPSSAAVPVRKLTDIGGEFPAWSADGERVHFSLGATHFVYDLARARAVDDSLEAARRAEAADTAAAGGDPEEPEEEEEEEEADDEDEGYRPLEIPIRIPVARDRPQGAALLRGARLVTMRGDEVIENGEILVRDGRIEALGPANTLDPGDAKVIDVSGATILPGFVDTHAHLRPDFGVHTKQPWEYLANLAFGVTTTRDPQTGTTDVLTYGDRVRAGEIVGPRIYSTGPGVFGSYQGEAIRDLDHARSLLRRYSEYFDTKTFKMYLAGNRQQRQWLIMAARELELMPTTEAGLDFALDLTHAMDGYPGIEHNLPIYPLYEDVVRLFAESGVVNTPTLIVSFGGPMGETFWFTTEDVHGDERLARFTPHAVLDARTRRRSGAAGAVGWAVRDEYVFDDHARFLADVVAGGGMAGVGSHGQLQGLGFHWEMWMLGSGGMPNHDVLRAATIFGASAIGLEGEVGSLEPGKLADLVVLDGNPLEDLRATREVRRVMVDGRLYDAATLDEVWPRERPLGFKGFVADEPGGK